jgi:hypothetical protein
VRTRPEGFDHRHTQIEKKNIKQKKKKRREKENACVCCGRGEQTHLRDQILAVIHDKHTADIQLDGVDLITAI